MAIGSHQSAKMLNDEWLTPPEIIKALGPFDLDPCSPIDRPWPTANHHFTVKNNGLWQDWSNYGRVWLNPPYGQRAKDWIRKLIDHGNGIALIFARTETQMFFEYVWLRATAVLFLRGRLHFYYIDGSQAKANAGAPSVLVAYGDENANILCNSGISGFFMHLDYGDIVR